MPNGSDWVEFDVRRTADGVLVIHHDPDLADKRQIAETLAEDLPDHVPTFEDAIAACGPLGINIEIKNTPGEVGYDPTGAFGEQVIAAWQTLVDRGADNEVLVTSFDPALIAHLRRSVPSAPATGLLVWGPGDPVERCREAADAGHVAINPHDPLVDEALMAAAQDAGLAVNVWTVNKVDRMHDMVELGVDSIITNHPAHARAVIDGLARRD